MSVKKEKAKQKRMKPVVAQVNKKRTGSKAFILILISVTALTYVNVIQHELTNWDDQRYIVDNPYIKSLSAENLTAVFTKPYFSNYHPLTTLTYAVEYAFAGTQAPWLYHLTNYLLHIINVLLVFVFIRSIQPDKFVGFATALLFAIHPMHVESVAWVSERKDLLYTLFLLLSLIFYIRFLNQERKGLMWVWALLFFVFSLLSKSAAVMMPVWALLCLWYLKSRIKLKDVLALLPFFALSLLFGIIALYTQEKAINALEMAYHALNRAVVIIYPAVFYLLRFVVPFGFNALHAFPLEVNGALPLGYYLAPFVLLVLIFFVINTKGEHRKVLVFGLLFFLAGILLVTHIVSIGQAIVAERYTYVPYIGLSFIGAYFFRFFSEKINRNYLVITGIIYVAFLGVSTWNQSLVWRDNISLWSHAIADDPQLKQAYHNRGIAYIEKGNKNAALADYNKAIELDSLYDMAYYHRARLYKERGDTLAALSDLNRTLMLKPDFNEAYNLRANIYAESGYTKEALSNYNKAIILKPDNPEYYLNRGLLQLNTGAYDEAIADFTQAISYKPAYDEAFNSRGMAKSYLDDFEGAVMDYSKAISLNPSLAIAYNNRAVVYAVQKRYDEAERDFQTYLTFFPEDARTYLNIGLVKIEKGDNMGACTFFGQALAKGDEQAKFLIFTHCQNRVK